MGRSDGAVSTEAQRHVSSRLVLRAGINARHRSLASLQRIKRGAHASPLTQTLAPQSPTLVVTISGVEGHSMAGRGQGRGRDRSRGRGGRAGAATPARSPSPAPSSSSEGEWEFEFIVILNGDPLGI